jgi:hypothetical protein
MPVNTDGDFYTRQFQNVWRYDEWGRPFTYGYPTTSASASTDGYISMNDHFLPRNLAGYDLHLRCEYCGTGYSSLDKLYKCPNCGAPLERNNVR